MKRFILICALALAAAEALAGGLSVKYPCSDGMVLQQNSQALVWGHAEPGAAVSIVPSWSKSKYTCTAGPDGVWKLNLSTPAASYESREIEVRSGKEKLILKDVLIGEVWVASGQSNMEMPLRGFHNCPVEGMLEEVALKENPALRMFTVEITHSEEPLQDVQRTKGWLKAGPDTRKGMSAVAYFFAKYLQAALDVPVGILALPRGGSRVESWLPKSTVEAYEDCSAEAQKARTEWTRAYVMYNGMQQPVKGYTARGFIWYQGCSNVGAHEAFPARMQELVRQWREDWGSADMPFYQVEIAPFIYGDGPDGLSGALLRQAQHEAARLIPNGGIVCTNDLVSPYEAENIHPCRKREVGLRLACLALNRDYGHSEVACLSPEADEVCRDAKDSSKLLVHIANCPGGLDRLAEIRGLEVAGEDGVFHKVGKVTMQWQKDLMKVSCPEVPYPVRVRYGWGNFKPGNLHNSDGLPLVPFDLVWTK